MNKGFTLIELLAVIVILAIIALIAVPIVLNIINDARESAKQRSIELYGMSIEQAIATYQINHPNEEIKGLYKAEDDKLIDITTGEPIEGLNINYEGSRISSKRVVVYEDGSIYMDLGSIGDGEVNYTYGVYKQTYKPHYYAWLSYTNINHGLPTTNISSNLSEINTYNKQVYLGFDSSNGTTIDASYVCFKKNNNEYCLKNEVTNGEYTSQYYKTNSNIIREAFSESANNTSLDDINNFCYFGDDYSFCGENSFQVDASSKGYVESRDQNNKCYVNHDGYYACTDSAQ